MAKFGVWTKVEDELPNVNKYTDDWEQSEPVIVCDRLSNVFVLSFERFHNQYRWIYNDTYDNIVYQGVKIVGWMPMPDPMEVK